MNQLSAMSIKFDEEIQGLLLLGSLPDLWEILRISLSNFASDGVISMDLAKSSVFNEQMRRKSQGTSPCSAILVSKYRGEAIVVLQKIKIKVGATLKVGTKMLSVIIVIRRGS